MSVELISVLVAVLAIGATLGGVILTSNRGLRQDMARLDGRIGGLEERLREDMGKMESRLREDTSQLRDDIKQLGERARPSAGGSRPANNGKSVKRTTEGLLVEIIGEAD